MHRGYYSWAGCSPVTGGFKSQKSTWARRITNSTDNNANKCKITLCCARIGLCWCAFAFHRSPRSIPSKRKVWGLFRNLQHWNCLYILLLAWHYYSNGNWALIIIILITCYGCSVHFNCLFVVAWLSSGGQIYQRQCSVHVGRWPSSTPYAFHNNNHLFRIECWLIALSYVNRVGRSIAWPKNNNRLR